MLTLILIGNTIVNVMFATILRCCAFIFLPFLSKTFVEITAWFFGTIIIVLFGETAPKILQEKTRKVSSFRFALALSAPSKTKPSHTEICPSESLSTLKLTSPFSLDELMALLEENQNKTGVPEDSMDIDSARDHTYFKDAPATCPWIFLEHPFVVWFSSSVKPSIHRD